MEGWDRASEMRMGTAKHEAHDRSQGYFWKLIPPLASAYEESVFFEVKSSGWSSI